MRIACGHETRLLARGVALCSLPFSLFRRPSLVFHFLFPSSGFFFLRTRFCLLVFQVLGRFSLVELLALHLYDCLLGGWVEVCGVRTTAHAEGAFE